MSVGDHGLIFYDELAARGFEQKGFETLGLRLMLDGPGLDGWKGIVEAVVVDEVLMVGIEAAWRQVCELSVRVCGDVAVDVVKL